MNLQTSNPVGTRREMQCAWAWGIAGGIGYIASPQADVHSTICA